MKPYRTLGATEPDYRPSLARRFIAWWLGLSDFQHEAICGAAFGAFMVVFGHCCPQAEVAIQPLAHEREVAAECRDVCARAGLRMVSVRPAVGVQSCECGER